MNIHYNETTHYINQWGSIILVIYFIGKYAALLISSTDFMGLGGLR